MKKFNQQIQIDAPLSKVWEILKDVEKWHIWTPSITQIRVLPGGVIETGKTLMIKQPKLSTAKWLVTDFFNEKGFIFEKKGMFLQVKALHFIEPYTSGTKLNLSLEFTGLFGGLAAALSKKLNERYLKMEAEGLKKRCERSTR